MRQFFSFMFKAIFVLFCVVFGIAILSYLAKFVVGLASVLLVLLFGVLVFGVLFAIIQFFVKMLR